MSLSQMQVVRDSVRAIFSGADAEVARAIARDRLHKGTALVVLSLFAEEARRIDPESEELVAVHTEAICRSNDRLQRGAQLGYGG